MAVSMPTGKCTTSAKLYAASRVLPLHDHSRNGLREHRLAREVRTLKFLGINEHPKYTNKEIEIRVDRIECNDIEQKHPKSIREHEYNQYKSIETLTLEYPQCRQETFCIPPQVPDGSRHGRGRG